MSLAASTVLTEVKIALLNDPDGAMYPDIALYPVLNKAYHELQTKLSAYGLSATKEISAVIPVVAGVVQLVDGGGLPIDLLYPISLGERASGSTSFFADMDEMDWEPEMTPSAELRFWTWREESIKFPAALTDREVLIHYVKSLGSISGAASPILINDSQTWLAQRTAVIAANTIGANPTRAAVLAMDLVEIWDDLRATLIKRKQSIPVRRRRTRYRVL